MFENICLSTKVRRGAPLLMVSLVFALVALALIDQRSNAQIPNQPELVSGRVKHVIWVWFENRDPSEINSTTAPFFTSFANAHAHMTNYFGVAHPSEPNYLAAFSGSTQGVINDGHFSFPATTDNLAKQLAAAGKSWRLYAQDYPGNCSDADASTGGIDGPGVAGQYVRKHNPAISFQSVSLDPVQCANIQPLANFDPTVNFALVVPNMINDMHDGTTAQGDAFLQAFVPLVTASPDWAHTLLIVTFDEGESNVNGGGPIYTAASAPWLNSKTITTQYNHFNLLRTTEDLFGLSHIGSAATAAPIAEILPPAAPVADFDGDGKTDVSVFRPSDNNWYVFKSGGGGALVQNWSIPGDILTPGDFDGDGKTDSAVFRPSSGQWFIFRSSDSTAAVLSWGVIGDKPVAGDYDGDGKTDVAQFRPSDGNWYVFRSSDNGVSITNWGASTDVPVPGDYDGDGKTDVAVYRPSTGLWFAFRSTAGPLVVGWGIGSDKPVPGDFDGDGKADVAIYRPSEGNWYIFQSSNNTAFIVNWGNATDVPVPGDYDGDGKADEAIFRNGQWFAFQSTAGVLVATWGVPGDIPIPAKYIP